VFLGSQKKENTATGRFIARSTDSGKTWKHEELKITPNSKGKIGGCHGSAAGITLRFGPKKGRLLMPARFATRDFGGQGAWSAEGIRILQTHFFNCAIYSDDHAATWKTSEPVQPGTGEGCLVERSDGTIYYNSRAYFFDGKRRSALSCDGGETFTDFAVEETLIEPNQGCNAAMIRVPRRLTPDQDTILLSNPANFPGRNTQWDPKMGRYKMTVHLSDDGGKRWPVSRTVNEGPSGYSSLAISGDGTILLLYEKGRERFNDRGLSLARFNLAWLTEEKELQREVRPEPNLPMAGRAAEGERGEQADNALQQYTITDLEVKTLAAKPGRYFGRCALEALPDGTWFLVYHESGHHGKYEPQEPKPVLGGVLHARFSADRGQTWSKEDHYLDGSRLKEFPAYPPGAEPHNADYEPGEPWVYLAPNGDLVVHSLKDNFNSMQWDGTWQMRSTDGGRRWTRFEKIDVVGIEHDRDIWVIDDHFIHDGVIYMGAREVRKIWSGMRNLLVKSVDNGRTWHFVSYVASQKGLTSEQGIEYLGNNTILCVLNDIDIRHTWRTYSHDMGKTWRPLQDIGPQAKIWDRPRIFTAAHLRNEPNWWRDRLILGASDQRTREGRSFPRRNCLWLSPDGGGNWQVFNLDDETQDSGYGDMLYDPVNKQYVAILYHGTVDEAALKQYRFRIDVTRKRFQER